MDERLIDPKNMPKPLAEDVVATIRNSGAGFLADLCKMAERDGATVDLTGMDARDSGAGSVQDILRSYEDEALVPPALPAITGLWPDTVPVGTGPTTINVNGTGFTAASVVVWDGADAATTFVSDTQVTVSIDATAETERTVQVAVRDEAGLSNEMTFGFIAAPPLRAK